MNACNVTSAFDKKNLYSSTGTDIHAIKIKYLITDNLLLKEIYANHIFSERL